MGNAVNTTADQAPDFSGADSMDDLKEASLRRAMAEEFNIELTDKRSRTRALAYGEMRWMARQLELDETIEQQAQTVFAKAQDRDLLAGRSRQMILAAAVYAAVRCHESPVTVAEVVAFAPVDEETLQSTYSVLNRELGLPTPPPSPLMYIDRMAAVIDCPESVRDRAEKIATKYEEAVPSHSMNPAGLAAACVYTAAKEDGLAVDQGTLADAAGVARETVATRYRTVRDHVSIGVTA